MRNLSYIYFLLLGFLITSCVDLSEDHAIEDAAVHMVEFTSTKGAGTGNIYRIGLEGIPGTVTDNVKASGTYCDQSAGEELVPCVITDSQGQTYVDGLRARDGEYKMFIAYPSVAMSSIGYEGCEGLEGYLIKRDVSQNEYEMYFSEALNVELSGIYLKNKGAASSAAIYDAKSMTLKRPLSQVTLKFACGEKLQTATLRSIAFRNVIPEGYYRPAEEVYYYGGNTETYTVYTAPAGGLTLENNVVSDLEISEQYLLAMDYAEKDNDGYAKHPQPEIVVEIGDSEDEAVILTAPLGWNFIPQCIFDIKITVNTTYVGLDVETFAWEDGLIGSTQISHPFVWSVKIPINGLGWSTSDDVIKDEIN